MNKNYYNVFKNCLLSILALLVFLTWFTLEVFPAIRNRLPKQSQINMNLLYDNIYKLVWRDYIYSKK